MYRQGNGEASTAFVPYAKRIRDFFERWPGAMQRLQASWFVCIHVHALM